MFVMNGNKKQGIGHKWDSNKLESIEEPIHQKDGVESSDWIKIIHPQIQEIQGANIEEWRILLLESKRTNNKNLSKGHLKFELSLKNRKLECGKSKDSNLCKEAMGNAMLEDNTLVKSDSILRIKLKDTKGIFVNNSIQDGSPKVKVNFPREMALIDDRQEKSPFIRSVYNSLKFIIKTSKFTAPFRSPVTKNAVSLKLPPTASKINGLLCKLAPFDPFQTISDENINKSGDGGQGEMKSSSTYASEFRKQKRKSSIQAELKIRKQIEEEKEKGLKDKYEMLERQDENSMFCGIPKYKKIPNGTKSSDSFISDILKPKSQNSPLRIASVLQDKTNSPMKSQFLDPQKTALDSINAEMFNSRFFLKDLEFEEEKADSENCDPLENENAAKIKEERSNYRTYMKTRDFNTKNNEGYTTVVVRRKSVIDLFNCPKTYYRKSSRKRLVYFDLDGWMSVHNDQANLKPILVESQEIPSYEWKGEKVVVDIIKRVDLWTDYSAEELIYKKVDKILN